MALEIVQLNCSVVRIRRQGFIENVYNGKIIPGRNLVEVALFLFSTYVTIISLISFVIPSFSEAEKKTADYKYCATLNVFSISELK